MHLSSLGWPLFVAIFVARENGDKQRPTKRRHVHGMLDETDPLKEICTCKYSRVYTLSKYADNMLMKSLKEHTVIARI